VAEGAVQPAGEKAHRFAAELLGDVGDGLAGAGEFDGFAQTAEAGGDEGDFLPRWDAGAAARAITLGVFVIVIFIERAEVGTGEVVSGRLVERVIGVDVVIGGEAGVVRSDRDAPGARGTGQLLARATGETFGEVRWVVLEVGAQALPGLRMESSTSSICGPPLECAAKSWFSSLALTRPLPEGEEEYGGRIVWALLGLKQIRPWVGIGRKSGRNVAIRRFLG
jgi:hypothetical protein